MKTSRFENAELFAQRQCKETVMKIGEYMYNILDQLKQSGFINSFSYEMEIWNRGYQIKFDIDKNYEVLGKERKNIPSQVYDLIYNQISTIEYISLQPGSFFLSNFNKGFGSLEASANLFGRFEKQGVGSLKDIENACNEFHEQCWKKYMAITTMQKNEISC